MPTQRHQRCGSQLKIGEPNVSPLQRETREPPDRRRLELRTISARVHDDERERVHQVHEAEFACRHLCLLYVAAIAGSLEASLIRALRGHERMFSRYA